MQRRAIILVLDSFGIGASADAAQFGDAGADTLGHIAEACARRPRRQGRRARRAAACSRTWRAGALAARRRSRPAPIPAGLEADASKAPMAAPPRRARARTRRAAIGKWPAARCRSTGAISRATQPCFPPELIEQLVAEFDAARHPRRLPRLGHRDHRGTGRGAYPHRQADLLHLGRQRVPGRRARNSISDWSGSIASASAPRNCWSRSTSAA